MELWHRTKFVRQFISNLFRALPIFGGLMDCTYKHHLKALKEFFLSFTFSTVTFWLSAIVLSTLSVNAERSFADILESTMNNGELLIFAVSMLGPVLLVATTDRQGLREFPGKDFHIFLLVIIAIIAAVLYAQMKTVSTLTASSEIALIGTIHVQTVVRISFILAAIAVVMRYLTIVYQKSMHAADEIMKSEVDDFAIEFAERAKSRGNSQ